MLKISPRLAAIDSMVSHSYDHIWDCCCDHGLLGARLLARNAAKTIHFIDVVPELMASLESKLSRFYPLSPTSSQWRVHCIDVAKLPLDTLAIKTHPVPPDIDITQCPQPTRHLIIIAGVGGDLMIALLQSILTNFADKPLEFILCPVHHHYKVRSFAAQMGLGLIDERLLQDKGRFYEVIHVSTASDLALTNVGSTMWDLTVASNQQYLQQTLQHYTRLRQGSSDNTQAIDTIISDYQALQPS